MSRSSAPFDVWKGVLNSLKALSFENEGSSHRRVPAGNRNLILLQFSDGYYVVKAVCFFSVCVFIPSVDAIEEKSIDVLY